MNQWGMHLPNGTLDNDAVFSMGLDYYVMLHLQAELYAYRARQSFSGRTDGVVEIRFYLSNWWGYEPGIWAEYCAEEYLKEREYEGHTYSYASLKCHVTPANEQNLALEGGGSTAEWYKRINDWNLAWLREFRRLTACPIERIHWPAFAYGHSDDQPDNGYIGMEICREAIEAYGPLDVHPYWFEPGQVLDPYYGHRFELAHAMYPGKEIYGSEAGNFGVMRESAPDEIVTWFQNLPPYFKAGALFIWEDPTKAHQINDLSRNPAIGGRIAAEPKPNIIPNIIPEEEAQPMPQLSYAFGFLDRYNQNPTEVGEPLCNQYYLVNDDANEHYVVEQVTANGLLRWESVSNAIQFFQQALPNA